MEIGLDLVKDKQAKRQHTDLYTPILQKAREKGLLLIGDGTGNFQLMPPLTTEKKLLDQGIEILVSVLNSEK